ncbi:MAG: hypothetical protein FD138_1117 [Planctomycetota bacterium]|nr:MAG: hypothetical protein FD138_1117 [Planctomycetota bacterium]
MFFILCPCCQSPVEVASDGRDFNPHTPHNVIVWDVCESAFDRNEQSVHKSENELLSWRC